MVGLFALAGVLEVGKTHLAHGLLGSDGQAIFVYPGLVLKIPKGFTAKQPLVANGVVLIHPDIADFLLRRLVITDLMKMCPAKSVLRQVKRLVELFARHVLQQGGVNTSVDLTTNTIQPR